MSEEEGQRRGRVPRSSLMVGATVFAVVLGLQVTGSMSGKSTTGRAAGMGSQTGGCNGDVMNVQEPLPDNVQIVLNDISERLERKEAPDDLPEINIDDEYVIKISYELGGKGKLGQVTTGFTGVPVLDLALGDLGVDQLKDVYIDQQAKRAGGDLLGPERVFQFSSGEIPDIVIELLEDLDEVEWVEPVRRMQKFATPNDGFYAYQWNMTTLGATIAWDTTMGNGVTVAVIDTGVSAGSDGFLDLLPGWDFYSNDADPSDEGGHGTHVAGTIAQTTGNAYGTIGVAPEVSILPVRVLGPDGGSSTDVAAGIVWAVDQGADVINMSLGGAGYSTAMADACEYAYNNGVVVVAATGNDSYTNLISYPAAYDNVIAVGASTMDGSVAYYSNYGPGIDLTAPGGDVTADLDGDGYGDGILQETIDGVGGFGFYFFQGTSMASPHVAGAAALLVASGKNDVDEIVEALFSTADDMGSTGYDEKYGYGIVNPVAALGYELPAPPAEPPPLEFKTFKTKTRNEKRGTIKWKTSDPASTSVTGTNGYSVQSAELVKQHKVVVRAKKNQTVDFTVVSIRDDGSEVNRTVTWPFE